MKKKLLFQLIAVAVVLVDQLTKLLVRAKMIAGQTIPVIRNIFHLTYVRNTGAGFGILKGQQIFLIFIAILVIGYIIYSYKKIPNKPFVITSVALILGGAVGNLIDRVLLGYVTDFLDFIIWPAFNIADSALTVGVIMFVIYYWKKK